jgi:hypothetical protein
VPGSGYQTTDSLRPGNGYWIQASAAGSLHLPTETPAEYTFTVNTVEIGAQAFPGGDAPGVLETATLTVGGTEYTLDLADGTETVTVTFPSGTNTATLEATDPDYINTKLLNFTQKTYSEQPDKQGTTITFNKNEVSQNQTLRYELIPSESPDGYQTVPEVSQYVNYNRSARWKADNTLLIGIIAEDESGNIRTGSEYDAMVARTTETLQNVAFPFTVEEYTTVDEFLDVAAAQNNTDIASVRYGNNANGISFTGDYLKFADISAGTPPVFRQEVFEGLHGHSDAGVFNNSDGTFNDTALFYSYILSNIETRSDIN